MLGLDPCPLCTNLPLPGLIKKALNNRYQSISNIIYLKRIHSTIENNQIIVIEDDIKFNTKSEHISAYLKSKQSRQMLKRQIEYLKFHTEFARRNSKMSVSFLMNNYNSKKRMLKFLYLSRILNIQVDNDIFSLSEMMIKLEGRDLKIKKNPIKTEQKQAQVLYQENSTNEQTMKKTLKSKKGKSKSKQKTVQKRNRPKTTSKPKRR